jgi:hypothetical protein
MAQRWFAKAHVEQHRFPLDGLCPIPNEEVEFEKWCHLTNFWWRRNFSHLQRRMNV